MNLSPHFTLEELTFSQTAVRNDIPNMPVGEHIANLTALCINVLEPLRELLDCVVIVNSGFRSPGVNRLVRGSVTSQHLKGEAADLRFQGVTVQEAFDKLKASEIVFDQAIEEGTWLHVSFTTKRPNRRETLRAKFNSDGKASYTEV
ncbi:peptidase M15 [Bacteriophage sp.]|nr:peptidase M15 [Bacteriophage sp.]